MWRALGTKKHYKVVRVTYFESCSATRSMKNCHRLDCWLFFQHIEALRADPIVRFTRFGAMNKRHKSFANYMFCKVWTQKQEKVTWIMCFTKLPAPWKRDKLAQIMFFAVVWAPRSIGKLHESCSLRSVDQFNALNSGVSHVFYWALSMSKHWRVLARITCFTSG